MSYIYIYIYLSIHTHLYAWIDRQTDRACFCFLVLAVGLIPSCGLFAACHPLSLSFPLQFFICPINKGTKVEKVSLKRHGTSVSSKVPTVHSSFIQITADANAFVLHICKLCFCTHLFFAACREPKVSELVRQRVLPPQAPFRYVYQFITSCDKCDYVYAWHP